MGSEFSVQINWLVVGLAAFLGYLGVFTFFAAKRRWTKAALAVAAANFIYVILNLVAPFRGILDPHYVGYRFGNISIPPGFPVTLFSGAIVVAALASACIAVMNLRGRPMLFVAVVDALLLFLIAGPEMIQGLKAPGQYRIEFGEYLQIPGLIAFTICAAVLCVPIAYSVMWSLRRVRA